MRREAAKALLTIRDKRRFNKGLYAWMGFRQKGILYTPEPRAAGKNKVVQTGLSGAIAGRHHFLLGAPSPRDVGVRRYNWFDRNVLWW